MMMFQEPSPAVSHSPFPRESGKEIILGIPPDPRPFGYAQDRRRDRPPLDSPTERTLRPNHHKKQFRHPGPVRLADQSDGGASAFSAARNMTSMGASLPVHSSKDAAPWYMSIGRPPRVLAPAARASRNSGVSDGE